MKIVNICEAKKQLSKLVDQAAAGNEVIISRRGKPIARITQLVSKKSPIRFGVLKGKIKMAGDFDAPLTDTMLAGF